MTQPILIQPELYTSHDLPEHRFAGLPSDLIHRIMPSLEPQTFERGERLFKEGDEFKFAYLIANGFVKISTFNTEGEEVFLAVQGARETLGEFAVFNHLKYPISATAVSTVKVWKIPAALIIQLRSESIEFCSKAADYLFLRTQRLKHRLAQIASDSIEERMKQFFLTLLKEYQVKDSSGRTTLPFYLTRKEVSQAVFTTQETATRIMIKWQKEGKVESHKDHFVFSEKFFDYDPGFKISNSRLFKIIGSSDHKTILPVCE